MKNRKLIVNLIEDHDRAYELWKRRGFRDKTLVHLDAHIDFGFQSIKPVEQIMKEAKGPGEIKEELERALLFRRYRLPMSKLTNIGNYIYPAMRDGIVNTFYWVIPGKKNEFKSSLKNIKTILRGLTNRDPNHDNKLKIKDSFVEATLYNKPFFISTLERLPEIKDGVLLDIDVDFLTFPSLKAPRLGYPIGLKKPWLYPDELTRILRARIPDPDFTTIAYSVNGGFTPIFYKFFGDEIGLLLKNSDSPILNRLFQEKKSAMKYFLENDIEPARKKLKGLLKEVDNSIPEGPLKRRFLADLHLWLFEVYFKMGDKIKARPHYKRAILLNPSYAVRDNNFGPLFLARKKYAKAEAEFKKILDCDPRDGNALAGMGGLYLIRRRYKEARGTFIKSLKASPDNKNAILGLAKTEFRLKNYPASEGLFLKYQGLEPLRPQSRIFLGRIYERQNRSGEALRQYKEAIHLGGGGLEVILSIFKILENMKERGEFLWFARTRYDNYKKIFYSRDRKLLLKAKRHARLKAIEGKLDKIEKILRRLELDFRSF